MTATKREKARDGVYTDSKYHRRDDRKVQCLHRGPPIRVPTQPPKESLVESPSVSTPTDPSKLIQYPGSPPRCGKCGAPVNSAYCRTGRQGSGGWHKVGYVCLYCGQPFINKSLVRAIGMEVPTW